MIASAQKCIEGHPGLHTDGFKGEGRTFGGSFLKDPYKSGIQLVFKCAGPRPTQWLSSLKLLKNLRDFSLVDSEDAVNNQTVLASGILAIKFLLDLRGLNKNRLI